MSYNSKGDKAPELWAILDAEGNALLSRGGSSTKPKLMVYPSEGAARKALNNSWTKQIIPDQSKVRVEMIYKAGGTV